MRTTALFTALVALSTSTQALQNIRIAKRTACAPGRGWDWYAYFIDSPPCSQGTRIGPTTGPVCSKDVTILGHQRIRFKGCPAYGPASGLPSEVWDGANPAFGCYDYHDGDIRCPNDCPGQRGTHTVRPVSWCSDHDPSG